MERADRIVMNDMIRIMIIFGVIVQIICLFIPGDRLRMTTGLWIGVGAGIAMLVNMRNSLLEALEMEPEGAKRYMQKSYTLRYCAIVIGFAAVAYFKIANIFTLIIGVMGLKISAYLQPVMHNILNHKN